ncbi:hypothetical protein [Calothrix sp. UHCC 0171]|nr:hypothetical protein [Calothrix sp. UHCC 0171]MEA5571869.1 hypothetical protein [Calothrix sp. UHCC 0171]
MAESVPSCQPSQKVLRILLFTYSQVKTRFREEIGLGTQDLEV